MIKKDQGEIEFYQSEILNQQTSINHFFSTRKGGVNDINKLAYEFEFNSTNIIIPKQTHSANIEIVNHQNKYEAFEETDALITKEIGICISVKTADCTPVLLFDNKQKVIAAIHSGWRGTVQNITGKTIQKMVSYFNSDVNNIIAAIGPCISQKNYEVGLEVVKLFKNLFSDTHLIIDSNNSSKEKARLNVRQAIVQQLLAEGINSKHIECSDFCTFSNSNDFYSARRNGAQTGRMLNGIYIQ